MLKNFDCPAKSEEAPWDAPYDCFRYELSNGALSVVSADAKGIYSDGNSPENAIVEFRLAVKARILAGLGGFSFG